jgi:hypothetical protein
MSKPILDSKGFLIRANMPQAYAPTEVTLRLSTRGLRIVARLCADYLDCGVPMFDNGIETADGELEALNRDIRRQLADQGIYPMPFDEH